MRRTTMTIYDYDDRPVTIQLPDKDIELVLVTILSGDETGHVKFTDKSCVYFDASDARSIDFFDGGYVVTGEDNLAKWFDSVPEGRMISYERLDMMSQAE